MKIEPLNAFKLIEASYLAELLCENRNEEVAKHLKQGEVEIANKIIEMVDKVNKISERLEVIENDK